MRLIVALLLLACGTHPPQLWAQESTGPSLGTSGEVGWEGSIGVGVSSAAGKLLPLLGGSGAFRLSPAFSVGGGAALTLRPIRVSPAESPERSDLSLGYGGLLLRFGPPPSGDGWLPRGSLLLGTGLARVRSSLVGSEVASDSFIVAEPVLSISPPVPWNRDRLPAPSVSLGYRFVGGADPLPGVERANFAGPVLSLSFSLVRDP